MRRLLLLASVVFFVACTGELQPGPTGHPVDMRQYLPDSLTKASQAGAKPDSSFRGSLKVGPDSAPVELEWATFRLTTGRYLASVSGRLLAPAKLDSIRLGAVSNLVNVGSKFDPIESATIEVYWFRHTLLWHRSGRASFGFDAAGNRLR